MAAADTARLIASLEMDSHKFDAGAAKATRTLGNLDKSVSRVGRNIGRDLTKGAGRAIHNIEHFAVVGGAALVGLGIASVHAAGDFEAGLNTINTVAQVTPDRLAAIGEAIRKMSRDTGTSVADLEDSYYQLVSAGIKTADAQNVLTQANILAIGGLSSTAEAVDLLTTAINSYGGNARNAARFANYFAEAIAAGKTTAAQLAESFAQVGPLAAQSGVGLDQLAAALGVMTATGTPTSEAMTQIRAAIVALDKPNANLLKLQKKVGVNFEELAKKKGLAAAYQRLGIEAAKAGIPMSKLTGRIEGALFAAQVTGPAFAKYNAELEKVRHSSDGAGVAQQQAAERMKGFNFAMQRLGTNLNDAAITIGSELLPQLADLAGELTTFLQGHTSEIRSFGRDLSNSLRDAVSWLRGLNWGAITSAFKTAAGFAKDLLSAFLGMPAWVQTAVLTGWGLNKLTGGAVTSIAGDLASAFGKIALQKLGLMTVQAAVVNVSGGVVNGGPASLLPAGEGATGLAGILAGVLPAVLATAAAAISKAAMDGVTSALTQTGSAQQQFQFASNNVVAGASSGPFSSIASWVTDFNGSMAKQTDAIGQLTDFLNRPHPDFLGDLGKLAMAQYHPDTGAPAGATRDMDKAIATPIERLGQLEAGYAAAMDQHDWQRAANLNAEIKALKASIERGSAGQSHEFHLLAGEIKRLKQQDLKGPLLSFLRRQTQAGHPVHIGTGFLVARNVFRMEDRLARLVSGGRGQSPEANKLRDKIEASNRHLSDLEGLTKSTAKATQDKMNTAKQAQVDAVRGASRNIDRATGAVDRTHSAVSTAQAAIVGAIQASRDILNVVTNVSVTANGVQKSTTTSWRSGGGNGSAAGGNRNTGGSVSGPGVW